MATKSIFNPLLEEGFQKITILPTMSEVLIQDVQTTDGTVDVLMTGSQVITDDSVRSFITRITAIQSATAGAGTVGDVWVKEIRGAIKKIAGTTTLVDTVTTEDIAIDAAMAGLSVTFTAGVSTLDIKVT
jgi:hypothetical protein